MSDSTAWAQWLADAVARTLAQRYCHPRATYRLQFEPDTLTFREAAAILPYLHDLGVDCLYASPYLKCRSGGGNCYAIVDYGKLDSELGSEEDYAAMNRAIHDLGMQHLLDTVPNHMSATPAENAWWTDVLENGPSSPHAPFFDIDWQPIKAELHNKVLLPVLGEQYGKALESGTLRLEYRDGSFFVRCYESPLPLDPKTYTTVLTHRLEELKQSMSGDSEDLRELESITTAADHLPDRSITMAEAIAERQREKEVIKRRLRTLTDQSRDIAQFIHRNVEAFNGDPEDPHSYDALDQLLDAQAYRLAHWKAAADEINYRRFFDINELAAVSMEDPAVFAASHALIFELLVRGDINGLRIDHIDGLYDPTEYLRRLQAGYLLSLGKVEYQRIAESPDRPPGPCDGDPPAWTDLEPAYLAAVTNRTVADPTHLPLYVVVEKILGPEEQLPPQWLLAGTTGYDFLNHTGGLLVESAGMEQLLKIYTRFIGQTQPFREVAYESKTLILRTAMSSDLQLLAHRLNRISEHYRRTRDFTLNTLRTVLRNILACFPVYRTYIEPTFVSDRDRQVVFRAVAQAKRRNPAIDSAAFHFVRDVLLLEAPPQLDEAGQHERALLIGRFQQVTSPVMAKGIEDTAFYRYVPLASLNEVGGDPEHGPTLVDEFHRNNLARQDGWPRSLLSTTTHDTKRSEDVRARIHVLSEIPVQWRAAVNRWARLNRRHHREVDGQAAPSRNDEYLFYQTLVGVWPIEPPLGTTLQSVTDRLAAYMEKATHEAKVHTSWINPNTEYDGAVRDFVVAALNDHPKNRFLAEFRRFHEQVLNWGLYSALSQVILKLTAPGVPDIYQGQEVWDFSMVDPDNRRRVDFAAHRSLLEEIRRDVAVDDLAILGLARELGNNPRDPRTKLFLTWRTLQFRRRHARLFSEGKYLPLLATGARAKHVCAFARQSDDDWEGEVAVVIAPRLFAQLGPAATDGVPPPPPLGPGIWEDTRVGLGDLSRPRLTNLFTGQSCDLSHSELPIAQALADFPVALLGREI